FNDSDRKSSAALEEFRQKPKLLSLEFSRLLQFLCCHLVGFAGQTSALSLQFLVFRAQPSSRFQIFRGTDANREEVVELRIRIRDGRAVSDPYFYILASLEHVEQGALRFDFVL